MPRLPDDAPRSGSVCLTQSRHPGYNPRDLADGGPLTVLDQKGKKVKFQVYARQGYTAPKSGVDN